MDSKGLLPDGKQRILPVCSGNPRRYAPELTAAKASGLR